MKQQNSDQFTSRVVDEAREFARDLLYLDQQKQTNSSAHEAVSNRWKLYKESLTSEDRIVALRAFREILGEEIVPRVKCKNCNGELASTGKNATTPWVHLLTGWVKCKTGKGWAEPEEEN